jgi:hypothetical protein
MGVVNMVTALTSWKLSLALLLYTKGGFLAQL